MMKTSSSSSSSSSMGPFNNSIYIYNKTSKKRDSYGVRRIRVRQKKRFFCLRELSPLSSLLQKKEVRGQTSFFSLFFSSSFCPAERSF
jgi:hypothetical protein